jgi:hypothetical protein
VAFTKVLRVYLITDIYVRFKQLNFSVLTSEWLTKNGGTKGWGTVSVKERKNILL